ncbi:hypothetical protein NDU88_004063 [Pleurodeles waltl]|uniref:Uncharacterized protein n=1 Tax=Pleurodeles waltl TaxID=8319 RepID=A0AAV7QEV6_PLEWA|nr:hypothetical protein NDU88_004063 [Pleurodeles waltl]
MARPSHSIDQKLVDLNNLINRAPSLAETTNIECACALIVDKLKQIPEALSTIIDDINKNKLEVHGKIENGWNTCYNSRRKDYEIKMEDNEAIRVDKDDSSGNLNTGTKQNNKGINEINKYNDEVGNQGKPTELEMQEKNDALAWETTKKQSKKLQKARKKQQISSAKLDLLIARQKTENTCETTSETAIQEKERIKSFPNFQSTGRTMRILLER